MKNHINVKGNSNTVIQDAENMVQAGIDLGWFGGDDIITDCLYRPNSTASPDINQQGINPQSLLLRGVNYLCNSVKVTLGAKGKTVVFNDRMTQQTRITKDGVTVAKQCSSENPIEQMAINIVREASEKTVKSSGDGTTTTMILAQKLINSGLKSLEDKGTSKRTNYYELSKQMDLALNDAVEYIKSESLGIEENFEKLLHVASVSANSKEIGSFVYDIMKDIGIYGHIEVKTSHNSFTKIDKVKGIKYHKGFYAPHFLSDTTKMVWKKQGVFIVQYDGIIHSMADINPFFKEINKEGNHPILFIVQSVDPIVLQSLINSKLANPVGFDIMITEFDGFGDRKTEIANDIAAMTGAAVFAKDQPGIVGFAQEVVVDEDTTSILGGAADPQIVDELVTITEEILKDKELPDSERVYYKRRLATLAGGVAVIHVGAPTEVEMKEKKDRIDDAVEAVRASIDRGISIGGCYTLVNCVKHMLELKDHKGKLLAERPGYNLVLNALLEPLRQLLVNSHVDDQFKEIYEELKSGKGYNVISNSFYDLDDYTIYDPTGVLIDSLTNAISVSKSILSIERAVYNK